MLSFVTCLPSADIYNSCLFTPLLYPTTATHFPVESDPPALLATCLSQSEDDALAFMADFRRRRDAGADNIWIVKPIGGFSFRSLLFFLARFGGVNHEYTSQSPLRWAEWVCSSGRPNHWVMTH